jgi:hypothetical protein
VKKRMRTWKIGEEEQKLRRHVEDENLRLRCGFENLGLHSLSFSLRCS